MDQISKRLEKILSHYNLSAGQFAEKIGIQKSSVSHLMSGRNKPSYQFLSKLATTYPDINLNWFITGEGAIFNFADQSPEYENLREEKIPSASELSMPQVKNKNEKKEIHLDQTSKTNKVENIIMIYDDDTFKLLTKT